MIKVMCNTSPIIGLSTIGKLELLWEMFEATIPEEVYNEIIHGEDTKIKGKKELIEAVENKKINIYKVKDQEFINKVYGHLHKGELEVIVGAKEMDVELVIMDERSARKFARDLGLQTIGILGILKLAKIDGKIQSIKPYLDELINNKFRLSENLCSVLLQEVGE